MGGRPGPLTTVRLREEPITLGQLLKLAGLVSTGGAAKELLQRGVVQVDGQVETRRGRKLVRGQEVDVEGRRIRLE
ncbi:RNA-binding protein [Limnochorda pilosa]|uniref:RNA-binding protein n=1 Tax=Limnochorda pilosa TaxID=1555112 RepID=A0A0K2SGA0_LIMPI|nr:RNA-binding protein [Limnochorda pilosa]